MGPTDKCITGNAERRPAHSCSQDAKGSRGFVRMPTASASATDRCASRVRRFTRGSGYASLRPRAGCPAIAVNRSAIPEVVGDAAIVLDTGRPDEVREAIEQLAVSATRNHMVSRARDRAALFSWDETYRRTTAVYEELSGRHLA
jgi:glycosyltransferase involved in cell wall biosynthesis